MPEVLNKRPAKAPRRLRGARSHITAVQRSGVQAAQTPSAVKQEISREYRELAKTIEENDRTVADSTKPTGIFGRWFHTSTS